MPADDFATTDHIRGTTPAALATDHIAYDLRLTLAENEELRIVKVASDLTTQTILAKGKVPSGGSPARTWVTAVHIEAQQSPPVPIAPIIDLFTPSDITAHGVLTIQGSHLPASVGVCTVVVGGVSWTVLSSSGIEVTAECPLVISAGQKSIVVTDTSTGLSDTVPASPDGINVLEPGISDLSPDTARVSAVVGIQGFGFSPVLADNEVEFGASAVFAPFEINDDENQINVHVPKDATTGNVVVTVGTKSDTFSAPGFTRTDHSVGTPFPNHGPVGATVNLSGSDLSDDIADYVVKFGADTNPAVVLTASSGGVEVRVPPTAVTGTISVAIGPASDPTTTFTRDDHSITSLSVNTGPVGTAVTVNGTNFSVIPADNVVKFNGTVASVTASTTTTLTTSVPAGATTGAVTVDIGPVSDSGPTFTVT